MTIYGKMRFVFRVVALVLLGTLAAGAEDIREDLERRALADGLYRRGLHGLAIAEYAALLQAFPNTPEQDAIYFRMGESLRQEGRMDQAEQAFQQVVRRFPDSPYHPRAAFKRASLFLELEQYEGAVELFEALLLNDPPDEWREAALYALAEALNRMGRESESLARVLLLLEVFPQGDFALHGRLLKGGLLARGDAGARERALALFADLAETTAAPRIAAEARFQQARLLDDVGARDGEAATAYLQLLKDFPDDDRAYEARLPAAWACFRAERFADARRLAEQSLENPDLSTSRLAQWLYLKANCERRLMHPANALETYARLLELDLDDAMHHTVLYERALTHHRLGQSEAALAEAAQVVADSPERDQDLLWLQAEASAALPDSHQAVQFYRLLLNRHPNAPVAPDALFRLAHHLQLQESWTEASRYYLKLAERFPNDPLTPRALFASGVALARAGQGAAALRDWGRLMEHHAGHDLVPESLYQKAMEEIRQERRRDALATLERFLREAPDSSTRRPEAMFWRGVLLHDNEAWTDAEAALRAALDRHPEPAIEREARFVLGMTLHRLEREEEAADMLQPLLDAPVREKFSPDRLKWLSTFQFDRGAFSHAADAARSLVRIADTDAWRETGAVLLGRAEHALERFDKAAEAFSMALASGTGSAFMAEAALMLGTYHLDAGRLDEAAALLQKAARLARDGDQVGLRAAAFAGLARAADERGELSNAIRYNLSIGLLFDDDRWVPAALSNAAGQLMTLQRTADGTATARELIERYPESPEAVMWIERLKALESNPNGEDPIAP